MTFHNKDRDNEQGMLGDLIAIEVRVIVLNQFVHGSATTVSARADASDANFGDNRNTQRYMAASSGKTCSSKIGRADRRNSIHRSQSFLAVGCVPLRTISL